MKLLKINWKFIFSNDARGEFKKLDTPVQKRIQRKIDQLTNGDIDPRDDAKKLSGKLFPLVSYRIGDYLMVCEMRK